MWDYEFLGVLFRRIRLSSLLCIVVYELFPAYLSTKMWDQLCAYGLLS